VCHDPSASAGRLLAGWSAPRFRSGGNISIWVKQPRRRRLALRLRRWVSLARQVRARRLLVDGSFVTETQNPNDVDAVVLLPGDFLQQITWGVDHALELEQMLLTRRPEEIFAAEDESDWNDWVEFFGRTREFDGRRKGLVEIQL
jgi:hypothetical protein